MFSELSLADLDEKMTSTGNKGKQNKKIGSQCVRVATAVLFALICE